MKLLALDTSTEYLTLAVTNGTKVLARLHKKVDRNHSSLLMPLIDKVLKKAGVGLKSLNGFCIGIGPGSFTGLRIGVATIKGLAYVTKKPIVTVPTLDAIAHNVKRFEGVICPVLDARKGKVYACLYRSDGSDIRKISGYLLLPVKKLIEKTAKYDKVLFLGDAASLIKDSPSKIKWHPRAETLARLGMKDFLRKRFVKAENLEPMYLYTRECDITGR